MFDIIVAGGGTSGCAAAYIAGKLGLNVLLIERKNYLGGAMTGGLVIPMMNAGYSLINRDFFNTLVCEMRKNNAQITFQGNEGWFNPHILKPVLYDMLLNAGVSIKLNSEIVGCKIKNNIFQGCYIKNSNIILSESSDTIYSNNIVHDNHELSEYIETRYIIDATGNCDIGKICNCNFLPINNDENQLVSMRFCMKGVDTDKFARFLRSIDDNEEVSPIERIEGVTYLSTAYTWDRDRNWALAPIFMRGIEDGDLTFEDTNYFQIFSVAGTYDEIAFNCPRLPYKIDVLNDFEVKKAIIKLKESMERIAKFCKKYFSGFENAYISDVADELGIRVSRRIKGKYVYTEDDLRSGKHFNKPILVANYPIDVHSSNKSSGLEVVQSYELPIESLISDDIKNLFVTGRCLSADFYAQAALRVQQSCFSMGEGVAKYIAENIK